MTDEETFDVYVVMIPSTGKAVDQLGADVVQLDEAGRDLTWADAEEMMSELAVRGRTGSY